MENKPTKLESDGNERTLDDYTDLQERYDEEVERPDNCNCEEKMFGTCEACVAMGFDSPYCDHDWRPASHWDIDEMCVVCGKTRENDEVKF